MSAIIIDFMAYKRQKRRDEERAEMIRKIDLLRSRCKVAFVQLDEYSRDCRNRPDDRVMWLLIKRGFLAKDGSLPNITNEAMYEYCTGHRPPWLDEQSAVSRAMLVQG